MTKTHGFTLVELLVTLAVASILLTVGVPSMRDMIRNNQLTATTNPRPEQLQRYQLGARLAGVAGQQPERRARLPR